MGNAETPHYRNPEPASSEERIRCVTVGTPAELNGPVTLAGHNPEWPRQFAEEAQRIRSLLQERALRIEHVGSTSVPELVAKPIIDILLVVANSADEVSYLPLLESAGYKLRIREPDWHEHRMFKGLGVDINLHVFTVGCVEIESLLLLRNHLWNHPEERQRYAQAKVELASRAWKYVQDYADAKSEVIQQILARARMSLVRQEFP